MVRKGRKELVHYAFAYAKFAKPTLPRPRGANGERAVAFKLFGVQLSLLKLSYLCSSIQTLMIQRMQSIYLFLASLAIFALYLFPLLHSAGIPPMTIMVTGSYIEGAGLKAMTSHFVALSAVTAIIGLIPLVIIFLFRNRRQQIALCWSTILVIVGYSFWMTQMAKSVIGDGVIKVGNFGIGVLLCPVAIVLLIAAAKAIQRDEKLIKSADRLR